MMRTHYTVFNIVDEFDKTIQTAYGTGSYQHYRPWLQYLTAHVNVAHLSPSMAAHVLLLGYCEQVSMCEYERYQNLPGLTTPEALEGMQAEAIVKIKINLAGYITTKARVLRQPAPEKSRVSLPAPKNTTVRLVSDQPESTASARAYSKAIAAAISKRLKQP